MKKLWIVLFTFCSLIAKSQSITVNRVYNSLGNDNPWDLICGDGCVAFCNFRVDMIDTLNLGFSRLSQYSFNAIGDTNRIYRISPFSENSNNSIYFKNKILITRSLEKTSLPGQIPVTYDRTILTKYNLANKTVLWRRFINPINANGGDYFGYWPAEGLFYPDSTRIYYLGTRDLYPTPSALAHPFIQEYDTSGILLGEADFLSPLNLQSSTNVSSALPDGDILIAAFERDNLRQRHYVRWVEGATFNSYKVKYLPTIYQRGSSSNNCKVIPIKPGDKYLVYLQGELFNSIQRDTVLYLTDSSLSLQNAYWVKRGKFYTNFTALDDGNIFAYYHNVGRQRLEVEKLNISNGTVIWSLIVAPNPTPLIFDQAPIVNFDDSGNVYFAGSAFYSRTFYDDIWLAKLSNVGQPWDPWRTNPNGTGEARKKFTFYPYPNPTTGRLRLRGLKETEGVSLRLFNNQGQEVWKGTPSIEGEIDISFLQVGHYHLEALNAQGQRWSTRVVRE